MNHELLTSFPKLTKSPEVLVEIIVAYPQFNYI